MNKDEALEAVRIIKPKQVIPTHYDRPVLFSRKYCPAQVDVFKDRVGKLGVACTMLQKDEWSTA
jgi:L-ascorbate metabolism protein UlaG (beta-lactamase superfamily)